MSMERTGSFSHVTATGADCRDPEKKRWNVAVEVFHVETLMLMMADSDQ